MRAYIFFRKDYSYAVEARDDLAARKKADGERGTIKVEDDKGRVVWRSAEEHVFL